MKLTFPNKPDAVCDNYTEVYIELLKVTCKDCLLEAILKGNKTMEDSVYSLLDTRCGAEILFDGEDT